MDIEQQIYTSCPRGKGYEGISGFQVKARSAGLTDSMSAAILRYSNHYRVPRDLRQLEYQYYQKAQDLPSDFLERFPIVLTYHHVEGSFYGLTRVTYLGKDYSGRPGNFYAHTLVFEPEALEPFDYNPIALSRSRVFEADPGDERTELDALMDLHQYVSEASKPVEDWMTEVSQESCAASYAAILSAFVLQWHLDRPILLSFSEQKRAADYIERLLMLLPPEARCRTTFTTYEADPYVMVTRESGEGVSDTLHLITTIGQRAGGSFAIRSHDLTRFLVWDFDGEKHSDFPEPSPYVQAVMGLCTEGHLKRLAQIQEFLVQLGAGRVPGTWDALMMAERLEDRLGTAEASQLVPIVLEALVKVAQTEPQIGLALDLVWPLLGRTMSGAASELSSSVMEAFGALYRRLPIESAQREKVRGQLTELVGQSLLHNDVSQARVLGALDQTFPPILFDAAVRLSQDGWPNLGAQTKAADFAQALTILQALAQEPEMLEWTVQTLWHKTKSLTEAVSSSRFDRAVDTLAPLVNRLPSDSHVLGEIVAESVGVARSFLARGFPARAFRVFELSRQDLGSLVPRIYLELGEAGWPGDLQMSGPVNPEDQKALVAMLDAAVKAILDQDPKGSVRLDLFVPAFRAAGLYGCAEKLWLCLKASLTEAISSHSDPAAAARFAGVIGDALEASACPQEAFYLLYLQTGIHPPATLDEWIAREVALVRLALKGAEPQADVERTLALTRERFTSAERLTLLGVLLRAVEVSPPARSVVAASVGQELGKIADEQFVTDAPDWAGLQQTVQVAHSIGMADRLWHHLEQKRIDRAFEQAKDEQALALVEILISVLGEYDCPEKVFELALWHTAAKMPDTLQQWKERVSTLTQFALRGAKPVARINDLLERIASALTPQEQATLLAVAFQSTRDHTSAQAAVSRRYSELLSSLPSPEEIWQVRSDLAREEHEAGDLLANDFLDGLSPWSKDSPTRLQAWQDRLFSHYPGVVTFASREMVRRLEESQGSTDEFKMSVECLTALSERFASQCQPLLAALISRAPIETGVEIWRPWFNQMDLRKEGPPRASRRAALIVWIKQIEAAQSAGTLDTPMVLDCLRDWQKMRQRLDREARDWTTDWLLESLGSVDLWSVGEFQKLVRNSLSRYDDSGSQAAVDYVIQRSHNDPVTLVLRLVVFGQSGMANIDESAGEKLADIVSGVASRLPSHTRAVFWKQLAGRAAHHDFPIETYQRFRQMTTTVARLGRLGRGLVKRLLRHEVSDKSASMSEDSDDRK
jgi:hypothetical protein